MSMLGPINSAPRSPMASEIDFTAPDAAEQYARAGISCLRSTPGQYYDSNGRSRIAPPFTPRFTHDPVTLEPLGLVTSNVHYNYLYHSNRFDQWASWFGGLAGLVQGSLAPDGSNTAWSFPVSSANSSPDGLAGGLMNFGLADPPVGVCAASIWVRSDVERTVSFGFDDGGVGYRVGPKWQKLEYANNYSGVPGSRKCQFVAYRDPAEDLNSRVYLWRAQMGPGTSSGSYIETSTGSVGLETDDYHITTKSPFFSSWVNRGGILLEWVCPERGHQQGVFQISNGSIISSGILVEVAPSGPTVGISRFQLNVGRNAAHPLPLPDSVCRMTIGMFYDGTYGTTSSMQGAYPIPQSDADLGALAWGTGWFLAGAILGSRDFGEPMRGYFRKLRFQWGFVPNGSAMDVGWLTPEWMRDASS